MASFEYLVFSQGTTAIEDLNLRLTALGSLGWELVGAVAADRTIGLNVYTMILKREVAGYPPPNETRAAWRIDPAGRNEQRYWDGFRWTEHVTTKGVQSTDFPNIR